MKMTSQRNMKFVSGRKVIGNAARDSQQRNSANGSQGEDSTCAQHSKAKVLQLGQFRQISYIEIQPNSIKYYGQFNCSCKYG